MAHPVGYITGSPGSGLPLLPRRYLYKKTMSVCLKISKIRDLNTQKIIFSGAKMLFYLIYYVLNAVG